MRLAARVALVASALAACPAPIPAQGVPIGQNLAAQLRWLQLGVVGGRLALRSDQINNLNETQSRLRDREERLQVGVKDGLPSLHYELTAKDVELIVDISHRERVGISRRAQGGELSFLEFEQVPGRDLVLEVSVGGEIVRHRAPTLWHLWLAQPELCRKNLAPLLHILHPAWKPDAMAEQITRHLLSTGDDAAPQARQWNELVAQLADPRYAMREDADRRLREAGHAVLPFLLQLEPGRLDAEQRFRIRRIMGRLQSDTEEDTPERAASWLRGDPRIWLALAAGADVAQRESAAQQLRSLVAPDIEFDPAADSATRAAQLARIAARLPNGGGDPPGAADDE